MCSIVIISMMVRGLVCLLVHEVVYMFMYVVSMYSRNANSLL